MMNTTSVIRRRTRLSPAARREQLMQCAIDVFSKRGLGRAGHAEIAELAQVSVATVFNYFTTRDDLVDNMLTRIEAHFLNMAKHSFADPELSAKQAIHHYLSAFIDAAIAIPEYTHIWLEWSSSIRENSWPRYLNLLNESIECISVKLQPEIDTGEIESYLTTTELARSICNQGYMVLQLINQPSPMDKADILTFMDKYTCATLSLNKL